jgi:hypothetical protein
MFEVSKLLIEKGKANVNALNNEGKSPLHLAATSNYCKELWALLVDSGAELNLEDAEGFTPLMTAFKSELDFYHFFSRSMARTIFFLSRGAALGKLETDKLNERERKNRAYFRNARFKSDDLDFESEGVIPYMLHFTEFQLYYLSSKLGLNVFLTSYLEVNIFNSSDELLFKALAVYRDSCLLECVYLVESNASSQEKRHLWNFVKELKKDNWSACSTWEKGETILCAQINYGFKAYKDTKASEKTRILYNEKNNTSLVNYRANTTDEIIKYIFAKIYQICNPEVEVDDDELAMDAFYNGGDGNWYFENASGNDKQLRIDRDVENDSDIDDEH